MRKYGESKTIRIMMATVPHVISGLGLRKFQADGFLLTRVYVGLFLICKELKQFDCQNKECTGRIFYRCSEQRKSHGMARRVQVLCTIKWVSSGRQKRDPVCTLGILTAPYSLFAVFRAAFFLCFNSLRTVARFCTVPRPFLFHLFDAFIPHLSWVRTQRFRKFSRSRQE